jgi:hypothetical protein
MIKKGSYLDNFYVKYKKTKKMVFLLKYTLIQNVIIALSPKLTALLRLSKIVQLVRKYLQKNFHQSWGDIFKFIIFFVIILLFKNM